MHRVLTTSIGVQFSVIPPIRLSRLVDRKLKEMKSFQKSKYNRFSEIFMKLYIIQKRQSKNLKSHIRAMQTYCLTSAKPMQKILQHFQKTSKTFNEKYLVEVFENLVKANRISQQDTSNSFDRETNSKVFYMPAFDHLIEEFKFGMKRNVFISWGGVNSIVDCLAELGYVDEEIVQLLIEKISERLGILKDDHTPVDNEQFRLFQGEKRRYYDQGYNQVYKDILDHDKFNLAFEHISQKALKNQVKQRQSFQLQQNVTSEEHRTVIRNLLTTINSLNNNLESLTQAIIAIREQYRRMCKASSMQFLLGNVMLNEALLEIEEELLSAGFIDIDDIRAMTGGKVQQIKTDDLSFGSFNEEKKKVQQILISYVNKDELLPAVTAYLQNEEHQEISQRIRRQTSASSKDKYMRDLSASLKCLVKLANSPYFLKKSRDGVSLISLHWEKNLLRGLDDDSEFLPVERIFRKVYAKISHFLKENYEVTEFMMLETALYNKVEWIQALFRIGLHSQAMSILTSVLGQQNQIFKKVYDQLPRFTNRQLISFLNVINYSAVELPKQLHHSLVSQIERRFCVRGSINKLTSYWNFSIENLCILINYIYLSSKVTNQSPLFYKVLVGLLQHKVEAIRFNKDSTAAHQQLEDLVNAFRILSFEKGQKFGFRLFESFFDSSKESERSKYLYDYPFADHKEYTGSTKYNLDSMHSPFKEALLSSIYKFTNQEKQNSNIILTGFKSPRSSNQAMTGIYITDSNESSIDGKHVNGDIRAYFLRMKQFFNLQLEALSLNYFLEIDYTKLNGQEDHNAIVLKSVKDISYSLEKIYAGKSRDWSTVNSLVKIITNITENALKEGSSDEINMHKITKVLTTFRSVLQILKTQTTVYQHFLAQRAKISILLENILRQVKVQNDSTWKYIHERFQSSTEYSIQKTLQELIKSFRAGLDKLKKHKDAQIMTFDGKRQSIETVLDRTPSVNIQTNVAIQILDGVHWIDKTFANYRDWSNLLNNKTSHREILIQNTCNEVKALARAFCPQLRQTLSVIPTFKQLKDSHPTPYLNTAFPFNWQAIYTKRLSPQQMAEVATINKIAENSSKAGSLHYLTKKQANILKLASFVHELKTNKSLNEVYEYIAGFQFIGEVMAKEQMARIKYPEGIRDPKEENDLLIPRDPKAYFEYLENRYEKIYLQSPYMEYILQKMSITQSVSDLLESRKGIRAKSRSLYQQGLMSRQGYLRSVKQADQALIKGMEKVRSKVLDQSDDMISDASLKMVQLERNFDSFKKLFQKANIYSRELDEDFIKVAGDYQRALSRKRSRAEQNLVKFIIVHKLVNQKQLMFEEKEYLMFWREQALNPVEVHEIYTTQKVKNLSPKDKGHLKLLHSNLSGVPQLALSDLILELNNFIDQSTIFQIERNLFLSTQSRSIIPQEFLEFTSNKQFGLISTQHEKFIFNEKSKLNSIDIENIIEMISTLKNESPFLRKRLEDIKEKIRKNIQTLNQLPQCRTDLISLYCQRVNKEFQTQYNAEINREIKQQQGEILWKAVFNKEYHSVSTENIAKNVAKIIQRMYLLRKNVPPFFTQLVLAILQHPNSDTMTKQNLLANLQIFKVPLILDTQDLVNIGKRCLKDKENVVSERLWNRLRDVSSKNFGKSVAKRILTI